MLGAEAGIAPPGTMPRLRSFWRRSPAVGAMLGMVGCEKRAEDADEGGEMVAA